MDLIAVKPKKTDEGWVLVTTDEQQDILVGPLATLAECADAAAELDLLVLEVRDSKPTQTIKELELQTLFRIQKSWYRLINFDKKDAVLHEIASKAEVKLPAKTAITTVSILYMK